MCLTAVWPSQTLLKLLPITFKKFLQSHSCDLQKGNKRHTLSHLFLLNIRGMVSYCAVAPVEVYVAHKLKSVPRTKFVEVSSWVFSHVKD